MKKPEFTIFDDVSKGIVKGLDNVRTELKNELFMNTPVDTGYLRDGSTFGSGEGNEIKRKGFSLLIKNEAFYAPYVYYGTKNIKARPWVEEAIDKINVTKIVQEAVGEAIRKK